MDGVDRKSLKRGVDREKEKRIRGSMDHGKRLAFSNWAMVKCILKWQALVRGCAVYFAMERR